MAFYDKDRKPRPGGDRPEKRTNDRNDDERNARRAQGPADRRNEEERGRPSWMDRQQDDRDHRPGGDRGPQGGGYGARAPRDRGPGDRAPREGGYGDRGPRGGGYGDRPQGGGYGDRPQGGGYGDRPRGGGYGDRPQGGDRPPYDRGPRGGGSGDRPPYDRDRGSRPGGDRPAYGDRPQRPSYGDRPERPTRAEPAPAAADEGYSLDELEAMTRRVVREEIRAFFDEQLARQEAEERARAIADVQTTIADVAEAVLEGIVATMVEPEPEAPKKASRKKKDAVPEAAVIAPEPEAIAVEVVGEPVKPKRASRKKTDSAPAAEAVAAPEKPKRTRKPKAAE